MCDGLIKRSVAAVTLACLLAAACSCSSHAGPGAGGAGEGSRAQAPERPRVAAAAPGGLGFDLVNTMGSTVRAVYVSPSDSGGWEENVLGADKLGDGDSVNIRFSPEEKAARWDIRVETENERYYAEWKGLDLHGVSRITLLLNLSNGPLVVARVE